MIFSADGQTLLLARRAAEDWSVEARTWMGVIVAGVSPFPRLISMALTPNGRFALARWGVLDKSDTHTFFDIKAKKRQDVPSSTLMLGLARIGDDGVVRSGSKVVLSFETEVSSAPTAASEITAARLPSGAAGASAVDAPKTRAPMRRIRPSSR